MVLDALRVAEEQGSNYYVAVCGYKLADNGLLSIYASQQQEVLGSYPPSDLLKRLQHAEAAHRRCKGILPHKWTYLLDELKASTLPTKPWLEQLQQEGDRWRPMPPDLKAEIDSAVDRRLEMIDESPNAALECGGCGKSATHLRKCGSCKEAQYCRYESCFLNFNLLEAPSPFIHDLTKLSCQPAAASARPRTGPSTSPSAESCGRHRRAAAAGAECQPAVPGPPPARKIAEILECGGRLVSHHRHTSPHTMSKMP